MGNGRLFRINGILLTESSGRADDLAEGEAVSFMSPYSKGFFWGDLLAKTAGYLPFLRYSREIPQGRVPELNEIFILFFDGGDQLKYEPLVLF